MSGQQECVYCDTDLSTLVQATMHHDREHPEKRFDPVWYEGLPNPAVITSDFPYDVVF